MSSTNKTANYQLSQFVGTDIPSILNDYNGDMRKIDSAIHDASVAGGDNASAIAELQSTVSRHTTEIGGINSNVNTLSGKVVGIESVIPATASAQNKLITTQEIPEIPSITELEQGVADLQEEVSDMGGDVKAIQLCVPTNASESNKFATMADISGGGSEFNGLMHITQTFEGSNYTTFGDLATEVLNKLRELIPTFKTQKYVLEADIGSLGRAYLYPSYINTNALDSEYVFTGISYTQQGLNKIALHIGSIVKELRVEKLVFAETYYPDSSSITPASVTGYMYAVTVDDVYNGTITIYDIK